MTQHTHKWIKCKGCPVWYCMTCFIEVDRDPNTEPTEPT